MKIRILLYKTPWKLKLKYLVNHLISIRTWSKWSHIETWTPDVTENGIELFTYSEHSVDDATLEESTFREVRGTCYTATMRGEDNGTVKRPASEVLDHPENWDYIEVEISDGEYLNLISWMDYEVGVNKGYGTWDILKFVSPIHFDDEGRNICSEFVNNALWRIGKVYKYGIVSPNAVAKKLIKQGYEVKSLI